MLGERARVDEALVEEHVDEREQQVRVGAGPDEVVLVGDLGRAAAARVDHDDAAAALPDRAQPAAHVGRGQQAAVGGERVRAEHQQVVGAVDVRDRDAEVSVPNISPAETCFGIWSTVLAEKMLRVPSAFSEHAPVEERVEVVRVRVAEVGRRPRRGRARSRIGVSRRSISANASSQETSSKPDAGADQRRADAVRVLVQRLQRRSPSGR